MLENRSLPLAILISLAIHAVMLTIFSVFQLNFNSKIVRNLEVKYTTIPVKKREVKQPAIKKMTVIKEQKLADELDILSKKSDQTYRLDEEFHLMDKQKESIRLGRKKAPAASTFSVDDKRIMVPLLKSEKITNPKYLSYNDTIRQKIRQRAFYYVDHPDFKEGEVYLTFVLNSNGRLEDIKIIGAKTHANDYLRDVGIRSVRESSPFKAFPKDLNYPTLTFNIVISFQVDNKK